MYRNIRKYAIKYTDVDAYDNIKFSSLLSFLEESACLSADELGFGYSALSPQNIGFIVANWYISLSRPIKLGDELEVHTWPLKPKHLIFLRDFELYCHGEKVGVCTSRWCMVDLKTFSVLPTSAFFEEGFFDGYNTERSIDFTAWKIRSAEGSEKIYARRAAYSDCDHYFHVNNTKYADFVSDAFNASDFNKKYINSFQITYVKQCKESEIIDFYKGKDVDAFVIEGKVCGELRVQSKVTFDEV